MRIGGVAISVLADLVGNGFRFEDLCPDATFFCPSGPDVASVSDACTSTFKAFDETTAPRAYASTRVQLCGRFRVQPTVVNALGGKERRLTKSSTRTNIRVQKYMTDMVAANTKSGLGTLGHRSK